MKVFVRAVITGIGLSVGKAIYDKVSERFFGENKDKRAKDDQPDPVIPTDDAEPIAEPS